MLGLILGAAAKMGRDKITLVTSPGIGDLGAWLEQLIAESTGKIGKGIIPVDREALAAPEAYGNDRIFAYVRLTRRRIRGRMRRSPRSKRQGSRLSGLALLISTTSGRNSSAGKSLPPSPGP